LHLSPGEGEWADGAQCKNDNQDADIHGYGLANARSPAQIDQGGIDLEGIVGGGFSDDLDTFRLPPGDCRGTHRPRRQRLLAQGPRHEHRAPPDEQLVAPAASAGRPRQAFHCRSADG